MGNPGKYLIYTEMYDLIGKRYDNDEKSFLKLSSIQIKIKEQLNNKVRSGVYTFESVPCCICKVKNFEILSNKDRYGIPIQLVICKHCGLIQLNPRMTQESYTNFYNCEYHLLYGGEHPGEQYFYNEYLKGKKIFRYLLKNYALTKPLSELRVLEVGCSAGGILQYFKDQGCCVKGLDLDKESVEFGKNMYGLDLSVGTVQNISYRPDVVIYADALEHLLDPENELARVREILPSDGILYIGVPGVKNLLNDCRDFLLLLQNVHTYYFSLRTLVNLLESNGFQMVVGNEGVASIFKSRPLEPKPIWVSDYDTIMLYINRWERLRKLFILPPGPFQEMPMNLMVRFLKFTGLYPLARQMYLSQLKKKRNGRPGRQ